MSGSLSNGREDTSQRFGEREDTSRAPAIVEVKRKLDGSEQRFETELVQRTPGRLVVLYRVRRPEGALDSYGCFWARRAYSCYHMVRPPDAPHAGSEVISRFDVVRDVELCEHEVRYLDMLLDLWVQDGVARWEDEDEVVAALRVGVLSPADSAYIDRARRTLERRHRRVVGKLRRLLRELGRLP